jgi:two-component system, NarL family, sensor histidine kinase UhpB
MAARVVRAWHWLSAPRTALPALLVAALVLSVAQFAAHRGEAARLVAFRPVLDDYVEFREELQRLVVEQHLHHASHDELLQTGEPNLRGKAQNAARAVRMRIDELERDVQAHGVAPPEVLRKLQQLRALFSQHESLPIPSAPGGVAAQMALAESEDLRGRMQQLVLEIGEAGEVAIKRQIQDEIEIALNARRREIAVFLLGIAVVLRALGMAIAQRRSRTPMPQARDPTDSTQAQDSLTHDGVSKLSGRRHRILLELAPDPVLLCGSGRRILHANRAARQLLASLGQERPVGEPLEALFAVDQLAKIAPWFDLLWGEGGQPPRIATALANAGGPARPVELAASRFSNLGSRRMQIVLHEVGHEMRHDATLRTHPGFAEQLIEAIPLPLSMRDAQGRFVLANNAFALAYRVDAAQLIGRLPSEVLPRTTGAAITRHDASAMGSAGPIDFEVRLRGPDGQPRQLQVQARPLRRSDGAALGVLAVETDITALRRMEAEVAEINAQMSRVAAQLMTAQEDERRRISRDLHDQVGQILTALKMQLGLLGRAERINNPAEALLTLIDMTDEALHHTRDLTAALHPHLLDELGLQAAVEWLINRFIRPSLPNVELRCHLEPARGPARIELIAFRVVQEALTNVVRHACATRAGVMLDVIDGRLVVEVLDDGEGFQVGNTWYEVQRTTSVGVASMQERVAEVNGDMHIDSSPGGGTSLRAVLPWVEAGVAAPTPSDRSA